MKMAGQRYVRGVSRRVLVSHLTLAGSVLILELFPPEMRLSVPAVVAIVAAIMVCWVLRPVRWLANALCVYRDFSADVAHQLRNPLTALRLRLENLEPLLAPPDRPQLGGVLTELERLCTLLDQMLALAKSEGLGLPAEPTPARAVAEERIRCWAAVAERRGVNIRANGDHATVAVPVSILEQALDVLLDNALSIAPAGSTVWLSVRTGRRRVSIEVVDEGPGLTESGRALAVQRYWRGSDAGSPGSGLGLGIASSLLRMCHGNLSLQNGERHGLRACIVLPKCADPSVPARRLRFVQIGDCQERPC